MAIIVRSDLVLVSVRGLPEVALHVGEVTITLVIVEKSLWSDQPLFG